MIAALRWHQNKQKQICAFIQKTIYSLFLSKTLARVIFYLSPRKIEMMNKQNAIEFKGNIIILIS